MSTTSRGTGNGPDLRALSIILLELLIVIDCAKAIDYAAYRTDTIPRGVTRESARTTRDILEQLNLRRASSSHDIQDGTEHLLQYGALLRTQILDTFGKLVYDHYDDFSMSQIEALYRIYQDTLERKYNIFDIVPMILNDPDTRPTKICAHINERIRTCLKESSESCMNIEIHDEPHPDTISTPALNVTRQIYLLSGIAMHYPSGFSLDAVLDHLQDGRIHFTPTLFSGLLHNIQYDSFDDRVRTAERELILFLNRSRRSFASETTKDAVAKAASVSQLLKNYLTDNDKIFRGKAAKHAAYLAQHVVREVDSVSENIELLGTVYDNAVINLGYLFKLILPDDVVDRDIQEARDYLLREVMKENIVDRYLRVEKYQQAGPDQLLMEILGQLRDIQFAVDIVTSLHSHASFWHRNHMIENLNELLELFDAYENLRNLPHFAELMKVADTIRNNLRDSRNVTVELLCSTPRACLRIGLEIVYNCSIVNEETRRAIEEFVERTACSCSHLVEDPQVNKESTTDRRSGSDSMITTKGRPFIVTTKASNSISEESTVVSTTFTESISNTFEISTSSSDFTDHDDYVDSRNYDSSDYKEISSEESSEEGAETTEVLGKYSPVKTEEEESMENSCDDDCPKCNGTHCILQIAECTGINCPTGRCAGDDCSARENCTGAGCNEIRGDDCDGAGCKPSGTGDYCTGPNCPLHSTTDFEGSEEKADKKSCDGDDCESGSCEGDGCEISSCEGDDCESGSCEGDNCENSSCEKDGCNSISTVVKVCVGPNCADENTECQGPNCPATVCVGNDCNVEGQLTGCKDSNCTEGPSNESCLGNDCESGSCEGDNCESGSCEGDGCNSTSTVGNGCVGPNCADENIPCQGPNCSTTGCIGDGCNANGPLTDCKGPDCSEGPSSGKCEGGDCESDGCEGGNCENSSCARDGCNSTSTVENGCIGLNCTHENTECQGPNCPTTVCVGDSCNANGVLTDCEGPDCTEGPSPKNCGGDDCESGSCEDDNCESSSCEGDDCKSNSTVVNDCVGPNCADENTECQGPNCPATVCVGDGCIVDRPLTDCQGSNCTQGLSIESCEGDDCESGSCEGDNCESSSCEGVGCNSISTVVKDCIGLNCADENTECQGPNCPTTVCVGNDCNGEGRLTGCKGPNCTEGPSIESFGGDNCESGSCEGDNCENSSCERDGCNNTSTVGNGCVGPNCIDENIQRQGPNCSTTGCIGDGCNTNGPLTDCNGPDCSEGPSIENCEGDDCESGSCEGDNCENNSCEGDGCNNTSTVENGCIGLNCTHENTQCQGPNCPATVCVGDSCNANGALIDCKGSNCTEGPSLKNCEGDDCESGSCEGDNCESSSCEGDDCNSIAAVGNGCIGPNCANKNLQCHGPDCPATGCVGDGCNEDGALTGCKGPNCTEGSSIESCGGNDCESGSCQGDNCESSSCQGDNCESSSCEGDDCSSIAAIGNGCIGPNCTVENSQCQGPDCPATGCVGDGCNEDGALTGCKGPNCTEGSSIESCGGNDCESGSCQGDNCESSSCQGDNCESSSCEGDDCSSIAAIGNGCIGPNCTVENSQCQGPDCPATGCVGNGCNEDGALTDCKGPNCTEGSSIESCGGNDCESGSCQGDNCESSSCQGDNCESSSCEGDDCSSIAAIGNGCIGPNCTVENSQCQGPDCPATDCVGDGCNEDGALTGCKGPNCTESSSIESCEGDDCESGSCQGDNCESSSCQGDNCESSSCEGDDCNSIAAIGNGCIGPNCAVENSQCQGPNCPATSCVGDGCDADGALTDCKFRNCTESPSIESCEGDDCESGSCEGDDCESSSCEGDGCNSISAVGNDCVGLNCADENTKCQGPNCPATGCVGDSCNANGPLTDCNGPDCMEGPSIEKCEGDDCESGGCEGDNCESSSCEGDDCNSIAAVGNGCIGPNCADENPQCQGLNCSATDCVGDDCKTHGPVKSSSYSPNSIKNCEGPDCPNIERDGPADCKGADCLDSEKNDNCKDPDCSGSESSEGSLKDLDCSGLECDEDLCEGPDCPERNPTENSTSTNNRNPIVTPCEGVNCPKVIVKSNCTDGNCSSDGKGLIIDCQGAACHESKETVSCEGPLCHPTNEDFDGSCVGPNCLTSPSDTLQDCKGADCSEPESTEDPCEGPNCSENPEISCSGKNCPMYIPPQISEQNQTEILSNNNDGNKTVPFCDNGDPHYRRKLKRLQKMRRIDADSSTPRTWSAIFASPRSISDKTNTSQSIESHGMNRAKNPLLQMLGIKRRNFPRQPSPRRSKNHTASISYDQEDIPELLRFTNRRSSQRENNILSKLGIGKISKKSTNGTKEIEASKDLQQSSGKKVRINTTESREDKVKKEDDSSLEETLSYRGRVEPVWGKVRGNPRTRRTQNFEGTVKKRDSDWLDHSVDSRAKAFQSNREAPMRRRVAGSDNRKVSRRAMKLRMVHEEVPVDEEASAVRRTKSRRSDPIEIRHKHIMNLPKLRRLKMDHHRDTLSKTNMPVSVQL